VLIAFADQVYGPSRQSTSARPYLLGFRAPAVGPRAPHCAHTTFLPKAGTSISAGYFDRSMAIRNEPLHAQLTVLPSVIGLLAGCFCFAMALFGTLQEKGRSRCAPKKRPPTGGLLQIHTVVVLGERHPASGLPANPSPANPTSSIIAQVEGSGTPPAFLGIVCSECK
jgi:hypothetical protein